MTLTIEDRPNQLLEMLWVREAHELQLDGDDLPPMLSQTPERAAAGMSRESRVEWERAWPRIWRETVAHTGRELEPSRFAQLEDLAHGSEERKAALHQMLGPNWSDEFGHHVFQDPSWKNWERHGMDAFIASMPDAHRNSPKRRDLEALIPAWRAGLTKIVTIPCRGEYTRKLGTNALIVTDVTRADSGLYRAALGTFRL